MKLWMELKRWYQAARRRARDAKQQPKLVRKIDHWAGSLAWRSRTTGASEIDRKLAVERDAKLIGYDFGSSL